ncbi:MULTISPECIES: hypothetical protein [Chryseobacterium]|uniref:Uncharacterized protein n=1 Tax=Chryseobacterium camelliae TaxID=1265445 RepID=A0ABU0TNG0_9FLAO|nr:MULTISPECIES: hypothetical protein [Chryseobacterium]MDT3407575.1 hypothetical protein [Pseudacidovorax intermedius]MDQ1098572.1 hypothetical protein [Chryseobacterium camelliae]MDQ1102496.1 hypothetical protein [Chryseobacterium sp. SORGH_AS_1048]MDR6085930.1 hypothetical protein [Chryseobacterium sp. SORGH_AS_0909]MDR6130296.1 hypothetical protein [Chryseobacterium sp. SORGH_AS_1175]
MEERDVIIRKILEKLYVEFNPEKISKLTLDQYNDFFFSIFDYINLYKNKYQLTEKDFVEFSKIIHHKYDYDKYEDNCWERVAFFMDELIFCFSTRPPYFFDSNFEDFKDKIKKYMTKGNGL